MALADRDYQPNVGRFRPKITARAPVATDAVGLSRLQADALPKTRKQIRQSGQAIHFLPTQQNFVLKPLRYETSHSSSRRSDDLY